ncbi:pyridoxamine 5'-phosphate oxidase [Ferruginibacter sp. SUN002]|uniref:pyridoxamine 5'-phosphate oxidase n=1 Tax=Ferruginibacter sp. SUN002 TaxID=2937789 RepID=UPI003D36DC19
MSTIAAIRKDYQQHTLTEKDVSQDPLQQFGQWWDDAIKSEIDEVNAMTLATVKSDGTPSARIVLLKGFDERGFTFYTNYNSNKGKELDEGKKACLVFFWKELERQIRITGITERVSEKESDAYFNSRPEASKIGAWSSPQSLPIFNRDVIEENVVKFKEQFSNDPIPRPPHWGGYIVKPTTVEFWQGRPSRLHDRILYTLQEDGGWKIERLAP